MLLRANVVATLWVREHFAQEYCCLEYSLIICLMLKWKSKATGARDPFTLAFRPRLLSERETDKKLTLVLAMDVGGVWRRVVKQEPRSGHPLPPL